MGIPEFVPDEEVREYSDSRLQLSPDRELQIDSADVLVLAVDADVTERLEHDLGSEVPLVWARSLDEAVSLLSMRPFALVVVDGQLYEAAPRAAIATLGSFLHGVPIVVLAETGWLCNSRELTAAVGSVSRDWEPAALREAIARALLVGTMRMAEQRGHRCRVLLVDPSMNDAAFFEAALADSMGTYDVEHATSLGAALAKLAVEQYSVIVADLVLPDARGLDTVVRIQTAAPHVPLIVLTALDDEVIVACAARLGAQNYLVKGEATPASMARAIRSGIERKARELELWDQARHDALTGLPNRVALENRFRSALELAELRDEQLTVFVVDLDGFKAVNDSMGHEQGDDVLVRISRRLRAALRDTDFVARFGGDEFVVLAPAARYPEGVAERLRRSLEMSVMGERTSILVTASVGHATYPHDGHTTEELLTVADRNMYAVKRSRISEI